ncbi:MAG TPA: hypothetical protein VIL37_12400 [Natronosporangium sp.]
MDDVGQLVGQVLPFVTRAAVEYGSSVVRKVSDEASDATAEATVGLGRRLLRRLLRSRRADQVGQAVTELGERPTDAALQEVLAAQLKAALAQDRQLAADLVQLLAQSGAGGRFTVVTGGQGVQVGDHNTQTNLFPPSQP